MFANFSEIFTNYDLSLFFSFHNFFLSANFVYNLLLMQNNYFCYSYTYIYLRNIKISKVLHKPIIKHGKNDSPYKIIFQKLYIQ